MESSTAQFLWRQFAFVQLPKIVAGTCLREALWRRVGLDVICRLPGCHVQHARCQCLRDVWSTVALQGFVRHSGADGEGLIPSRPFGYDQV